MYEISNQSREIRWNLTSRCRYHERVCATQHTMEIGTIRPYRVQPAICPTPDEKQHTFTFSTHARISPRTVPKTTNDGRLSCLDVN